MVQKGICWTVGERSYFGFIEVYRVETMDMGRFH